MLNIYVKRCLTSKDKMVFETETWSRHSKTKILNKKRNKIKKCRIPLFSSKEHIVTYPGTLFLRENRRMGTDLLYQNWDMLPFRALKVFFEMKQSLKLRRKT